MNIVKEIVRYNKIMGKEKQTKELTPKQERFCQLYATEVEFFGNGTQAYIEAYDPETNRPNWYKSAQASASRLLSNVIVYNRINQILEESGFNDIAVDKQLAFLLTQHTDLKSKLGAIKEYNKLKSRITEKQEVTHNINPITELSVEELKKLAGN